MHLDRIDVPVRIDAPTFRRFAYFDTFRRQKRWRSPLIFALILVVSSILCFLLRDRAEGGTMLGVVLLVIGLGLPAAYFLSFHLSVRTQIKRMGLTEPREVYTVALDQDGITVTAGKDELSRPWGELAEAWRVKGCTDLYVTPVKAYLLPDGQGTADADAMWALICAHMPAGRTFQRI